MDVTKDDARTRVIKEQYVWLCAERERIMRIIEEKEQFFDKGIPVYEDLEEMILLSHRMTELLRIMDESSLGEYELNRMESLLKERYLYENLKYYSEAWSAVQRTESIAQETAIKKFECEEIKKQYAGQKNISLRHEEAYAMFAGVIFVTSSLSIHLIFANIVSGLFFASFFAAVSGFLMLKREWTIKKRQEITVMYERQIAELENAIKKNEAEEERCDKYKFYLDDRKEYMELIKRYNFIKRQTDELYRIIYKLETYLKRFPNDFLDRLAKRYPKNITQRKLAENKGKGPLGDGRVYIKLFSAVRDYRNIYLTNKKILAETDKKILKLIDDNKDIDFDAFFCGRETDKPDAGKIAGYLPAGYRDMDIRVFDGIVSTNTYIKSEIQAKTGSAGSGAMAVVADYQTGGRGRLGRSFFSPPGTGLYMSVRPGRAASPGDMVSLTSVAAVAVCEIIEMFADEISCDSGKGAVLGIKWVNDIYYGGRKCCGILAESVPAGKGLREAVIGIGINVYEPKEGFPDELKDKVCAIRRKCQNPGEDIRNKIAAGIIERLLDYYDMLMTNSQEIERIMEIYRSKSIVLGKKVRVLENGEAKNGKALEINREGHLLVEYDSGERQWLNTGEISIGL